MTLLTPRHAPTAGARPTIALALCLLGVLCGPSAARAQLGQPDPWEAARKRVGPLAFTPTVSLKTIGWETNVFNNPVDPKRDFVITPAGHMDWWLRAGRSRLHGTNEVWYARFAKFTDQGGLGQSHSLTFEVPLARIKPYVTGAYTDTNDRVGFEIDARARHTESAARAGVVTRLTAKTGIDLYARHTRFRYTGDDTFQGSLLAERFNRESSAGGATLRHSLTPLTQLQLTADWSDEQFTTQPLRDNRSFSIVPGVSFEPAALLKGTARVGYRKFDMKSPDVPDFEGVVASVDLSYVLLGRTRFTVRVNRDILFSYDTAQPYYLQTGVGGTVRQGLGRGFDVEARTARYRLDYRTSTGAEAALRDRVDSVTTYGGGIGYRLGDGSRVAFYIDQHKRSSPTFSFRDYDGLRYGFTVSVGL